MFLGKIGCSDSEMEGRNMTKNTCCKLPVDEISGRGEFFFVIINECIIIRRLKLYFPDTVNRSGARLEFLI